MRNLPFVTNHVMNQGFANTPSTGINKPVTPSERQMIFTEMDSLRS